MIRCDAMESTNMALSSTMTSTDMMSRENYATVFGIKPLHQHPQSWRLLIGQDTQLTKNIRKTVREYIKETKHSKPRVYEILDIAKD